MAVNYGAIGAVIGHEMTHGFDDQGRQFDAVGNLRDWWSKKSADEYNKRRKAVVDQYSEYTPLPGQHVNGELTQGENIADIGGIKLAYAALQKALDKNPEDRNKKIDGLTPEQRFFLSFAAIWRSKIRDEDQKLRLTTDPHSPAQFRVNGPLVEHAGISKGVQHSRRFGNGSSGGQTGEHLVTVRCRASVLDANHLTNTALQRGVQATNPFYKPFKRFPHCCA